MTTTATGRTPQQRLADVLLGRPVDDWIRERRETRASWRAIARDLTAATGGQVDVTDVTVRIWASAAGLPTGRPDRPAAA